MATTSSSSPICCSSRWPTSGPGRRTTSRASSLRRTTGPRCSSSDGDELFDHYRHTLEALGNEKGMLGLIFGKAQNKFQDPAKLRRLIVDLIDAENWSSMSADVKGDAYEGLLEKNAQDTKSGAGQYFTPRPLIPAMVDCIAPRPGERVCDPACGTGGFLFAAHNYIVAPPPQPDQGREAPPEGRRLPRLGAGAGHGAPVRDEPDAARHRLGQERARRGEPTRWPPTPASASTWCWPIRRSARRAAR